MGPEQKINLPAYWIDKYEVTNGDWKKFRDDPGYAMARVIYAVRLQSEGRNAEAIAQLDQKIAATVR